jgi:outer membrane immunogenic protein
VIMKKMLLVAVAIAVFSSAGALAGDMRAPVYKAPVAAPAPSQSWTGFYAGVNGGYGWGRTSNSAAEPFDFVTAVFLNIDPIGGGNFLNASELARAFHQRGAVIGAQIGYNWQISSQWVAGLEADIQWADVGDKYSRTVATTGIAPSLFDVTGERRLQWFGTVRGRIGYLVTPDLLLFGTAGLAYGKTSAKGDIFPWGDNNGFGVIGLFCVSPGVSLGITPGSPCYAGSGSRTSVGWTAGFGLEYRLLKHLTAKLEYLHVDLGGQALLLPSPSPPSAPGIAMAYSFNREAVDIVRVGLNYSFGAWGQGGR